MQHHHPQRASLIAQLVKNPPAMQETLVRSLGWEDPLVKGTATYSSILENSMDYKIHGVANSRTPTKRHRNEKSAASFYVGVKRKF